MTSSIPLLTFSDQGFQPPIFPKSIITFKTENQLKFVRFTHFIARIVVFRRSFRKVRSFSRISKVRSVFYEDGVGWRRFVEEDEERC